MKSTLVENPVLAFAWCVDQHIADIVDMVGIVAETAFHRVGAQASVERIVAGTAVQHVVAGAADQPVRAWATGDHAGLVEALLDVDHGIAALPAVEKNAVLLEGSGLRPAGLGEFERVARVAEDRQHVPAAVDRAAPAQHGSRVDLERVVSAAPEVDALDPVQSSRHHRIAEIEQEARPRQCQRVGTIAAVGQSEGEIGHHEPVVARAGMRRHPRHRHRSARRRRRRRSASPPPLCRSSQPSRPKAPPNTT